MMMEADSVAEAGYRGALAGKSIVVPGVANRVGSFMPRLVPRSLVRKATEELLVQVGAAVETRGRLKPTLTGILFFGRDTQQFYPAFTITFMHFAGTSTVRANPEDGRREEAFFSIVIDILSF